MQENRHPLKSAWQCELCYNMLLAFLFFALFLFLSFYIFSLLSFAVTQSNLLFIIGPQVGKDASLSYFYHFLSHYWAARLLVFTDDCHFAWFCTRPSGCSTTLALGLWSLSRSVWMPFVSCLTGFCGAPVGS